MKADIRDPGSLAVLRPLEVAAYLRASGWKQVESEEGRFSVWTRDDGYEVLLPLQKEWRDYLLRMGDLLRTVAEAEGRSQLAVLSDLLVTGADVLRLRIADDELADGSMPIEEHSRIAQKARDLMMAAACSAIERRPVWHTRKPDRAVDYLRGVRVGQTEHGSYVWRVICPVPPMLRAPVQHEMFEEVEEPYERRVTTQLAAALEATEEAAERSASDGSVKGFEEAVSRGVSANLCEALAGFSSGEDANRTVEFAFSWSRRRPAAPNQISRVSLSQDRIPYVREAGRLLRERAPVKDFELEGPVVKLARQESSGPGEVTVYGLLDGAGKRVRLELPEDEYNCAVEAHRNGHTIRCFGELVREGRGYRLRNPSGLVVDRDDL